MKLLHKLLFLAFTFFFLLPTMAQEECCEKYNQKIQTLYNDCEYELALKKIAVMQDGCNLCEAYISKWKPIVQRCKDDPNAEGCPCRKVAIDTDGDGVLDQDDNCDYEKGPATNLGCPLPEPKASDTDTDSDGVMDNADDCPKEKGSKKLKGCPDIDGDNVPDKDDDCPTEKGLAENRGCPYPIPVIEMVFVEGDTYLMGCTNEQGSDCDSDEKPMHSVTVASFSIGKYEITQAQWKAIMSTSPSAFTNCDNCPVENVSWDDIQLFIQQLNKRTHKTYRLPKEAEWEFAARGGIKTKGYKYAGGDDIGSVAWYDSNSGSKTHPVGKKAANELGIYDMSGNVWEWCEDDWHGDYTNAPNNGVSWISATRGSYRVLRGGSWNYSARYCRVSDRNYHTPDNRSSRNGFRLVCLP